MTRYSRRSPVAAGGLFGGCLALTQAAYAPDPFAALTSSAISITIVLTTLYIVDGRTKKQDAERDRTHHTN